MPHFRCLACGHEWLDLPGGDPRAMWKACPKCKGKYWKWLNWKPK
jgi:predicted  nucleic acid-binding Zn-ribbon protein